MRTQKVRIDGILSDEEVVRSGIPQGTVLGPFLFLLFINDMPDSVLSKLFLYADDSKIYRVINNASADREILQNDLDRLYEWSRTWLMKIHPDKLFGMEIGGSRECPEYDYTVGPMMVKYSKVEKDIGVEVDDNLVFAQHIDTIVKKANSKAGWLRRSFQFLTPKMFRPLYMQIVRSQMEYASSVWNPHHQTLIDKIEKVQERATKMLPDMKGISYEDRLRLLNLPTLRFRKLRGDMINAYKILNCENKSLCPSLKLSVDYTGRAGRNSLSLFQSRNELDVRKFYFSERVVAAWNTLPENVVTAPNINCFKSRLDRFWRNEPLKFDYKANLTAIRVTRR